MKSVSAFAGFRPVVGLLAIGVLAFSLTLEGAPTRKGADRGSRGDKALNAPSPEPAPSRPTEAKIIGLDTAASESALRVQPIGESEQVLTIGSVGRYGGLPVAETVVVNPYDDPPSRMRARGELVGPYRKPLGAAATGGACSFDVECDDCDPCTLDTCEIEGGAPAGSGKCVNAPVADGLVGQCSDGVFCNGAETCQSGSCAPGTNPCESPQLCNETLNECADPCTENADCDDGEVCNGAETCVDSLCVPGENPCGAGASCTERTCNNAAGSPCIVDADCPGGGTFECTEEGPGCFAGRCCTGTEELTCSVNTKESLCSGNWYATDAGQQTTGTNCEGPEPGVANNAGMQCPRYTGGIGPQGEFNFDEIVVVSDSVCRADASFRDEEGRSGAYRLGDDYTALGDPGFMELEALRWVGGVEVRVPFQERVVFEFYDAQGNFIEDVFQVSGAANAIRPLFIDPPLVIPTSGFVVVGVANQFSPDGAVRWLSITDGPDVGSNNPGLMWLENNSHSGPLTATTAGGTFDFGTDGVPSSGQLAFELAAVLLDEEPVGACCDVETGECIDGLSQWVCRSGTCEIGGGACVDSADCAEGDRCLRRTFLGVGSQCAVCDENSGANSFQPCRRCSVSGDTCDSDGQCPEGESCDPNNAFCDAGASGGLCVATEVCAGGACCDPATGGCTDGTTEGTCTGEFLGFGTDCDPNCCVQPVTTGGDNCEDAIVHNITVPDPDETRCNGTGALCNDSNDCGGDPCLPARVVVTITGDNTNATSTFADRDSCTLNQFDPGAEGFDPGWWEGFQIDDCALVRIDNCCTDPAHIPQYRVITRGCPCSDFIFSTNQARGQPFCTFDDNLWSEYGPLEPDTYYFPTFSALSGTKGEYQLHFTVQACPEAACCYLACDRPSPQSCTQDADCTAGVCVGGTCRELCTGPDSECSPDTCESRCDIMNQQACEALEGTFLGPPIRFPAVGICQQNNTLCPDRVCSNDPNTSCTDDSQCGGEFDICLPCCDPFNETNCGTCQIGSCCAGPGDCREFDQFGSFTKESCDPNQWAFIGGLKCQGGRCDPAFQISCAANADCPEGSVCLVDAQQANQPNPCPVCEIDSTDNCRFSPQDETGQFGGFIFFDDRSGQFFASTRIADDFRPAGDTISSICWDPGFFNPVTGGECVADACSGDPGVNFPDGQWQVTIYDDAGGLPGSPVGPGPQLVNVIAKRQIPGFRVCLYSATLPQAVSVNPGECYWLEISGVSRPDGCTPYWTNTPTGNAFSFQDSDGTYDLNDAVEFDFISCLDSGILKNEPTDAQPGPDCGPIEGTCCNCPPAVGDPPICTEGTFADCAAIDGRFNFDVTECPVDPATLCPTSPGPHDDCQTPLVVTDSVDDPDEITLLADNFCATSDGPTTVFCAEIEEPVTFEDDLWYSYTATCTDDLTVSTCAANNDFDAVLAVYVNEADPTSCGCPGDPDIVQLGPCSDFDDDECAEFTDAFLRLSVEEGNCYMFRLGGQGTDTSQGVTDLTFSCGVTAPVAPDPLEPLDSDFSDPDGKWLNRAGGIKAPLAPSTATGGSDTAIKVVFETLYYVSGEDADGADPGIPDDDPIGPCPPGRTKPGLNQFEIGNNVGTPEVATRWLGVPGEFVDNASPALPNYIAAPLVCEADAALRDWSSKALAADFNDPGSHANNIEGLADKEKIYFFGAGVVPCSVYRVFSCTSTTDPSTCSEVTYVKTALLADVWSPFGLVNVEDITRLVDKFRGVAFVPGSPPGGGPLESRALLRGNETVFDIGVKVNVTDITNAIDGFRGLPYKEDGPCDPGTAQDQCGNTCDTSSGE